MIDKRMYRETFSQLRASDQAKQEVLQKMQEMKQRKRMPRVLRGAALAAAMVMALAVTAGAVNVATDGALFRQFTIVWTSGDQYLARDDQGNAVSITLVDGDVVTEEDGRLILHVDGEDIDITEESGAQTWTGTIYLNFPVTYEKTSGVTDSMTLASTPVSVDVTTLLAYYPWAIRKSGSWKSCNRDDGHFRIRKGSWRDVLNYQSGTGDNDAHYRDGSAWKRSPLID